LPAISIANGPLCGGRGFLDRGAFGLGHAGVMLLGLNSLPRLIQLLHCQHPRLSPFNPIQLLPRQRLSLSPFGTCKTFVTTKYIELLAPRRYAAVLRCRSGSASWNLAMKPVDTSSACALAASRPALCFADDMGPEAMQKMCF